ncbi:hypothetical protein LTS18_006444, partial [Coniosporium uncinatum]
MPSSASFEDTVHYAALCTTIIKAQKSRSRKSKSTTPTASMFVVAFRDTLGGHMNLSKAALKSSIDIYDPGDPKGSKKKTADFVKAIAPQLQPIWQAKLAQALRSALLDLYAPESASSSSVGVPAADMTAGIKNTTNHVTLSVQTHATPSSSTLSGSPDAAEAVKAQAIGSSKHLATSSTVQVLALDSPSKPTPSYSGPENEGQPLTENMETTTEAASSDGFLPHSETSMPNLKHFPPGMALVLYDQTVAARRTRTSSDVSTNSSTSVPSLVSDDSSIGSVHSLEDQGAVVSADKEAKEQEIVGLQAALNLKDAQLAQLRNDMKLSLDYEKDLQSYQKLYEHTSTNCAGLSSMNDKLAKEVNDRDELINGYEHAETALRNENASISHALDAAQIQVKELEQTIRDTKDHVRERDEALEECRKKGRELLQRQKDAEELTSENVDLTSQVTKLRAQLATEQAAKKTVQEKKTSDEQDELEQLKHKLAASEEEKAKLKADNHLLKSKISKAEKLSDKAIDLDQENFHAMTKDVARAFAKETAAELKKTKVDLDACKTELAKSKTDIKQLRAERALFQKIRDACAAQMDKDGQLATRLAAALQDAERDVSDAQAQAIASQQDHSEKAEECEKLNNEFRKKSLKVDELTDKVDHLELVVERQQSELEGQTCNGRSPEDEGLIRKLQEEKTALSDDNQFNADRIADQDQRFKALAAEYNNKLECFAVGVK